LPRFRLCAPLAGVAISLFLAVAGTASARTPLPQVTGPLAVSTDSYPFGAADHQLVPQDLARHGYVEEEYLVSGKANVYDWPATGPAVVRTPDAPYTTRMLVRRPRSMRHFSGHVIVEPLNPSNLFDLNIGWALSHDQFMRNGDVWVGITAKPITVAALKTFDPVRYAPLSFANPLPLSDPRNCLNPIASVDPVALRSRLTEDGLFWDIYSQVGAWLRSGAGTNPLAHHVDRLYGFGYSQTGGYMVDYINAIQPLVVQSDGRPMYDGYIVGVAGGGFVGGVPINQCSPTPPATDPRLQIRDVGVPVIRIMSQSDYLLGSAARREDGNTTTDPFRHYEMAGAAHATPDELFYSAAPADIVKAGRDVPPASCNDVPRSRFPSSIHFDAALQNLDLWVRYKLPPPPGVQIATTGTPLAPVLDEFGNVTGGLRSPFVDVPTSTWFGSTTGPSFCFIAGHEVPFTQERLDALYPTHGAYVRAVTRDVAQLVAKRYLTVPDGVKLVVDAAKADVP
jgi:hypothetical protein